MRRTGGKDMTGTELYALLRPWLTVATGALAAIAATCVVHRLTFASLARSTAQSKGVVGRSLVRHARRPRRS